jgi:hypothetical protein
MLPFDLPFDKLRVNGYAILASSMTTRRPLTSTAVVLSRHTLTPNDFGERRFVPTNILD